MAFENNCYRRLSHVHCIMHTPNVEIHGIVAGCSGTYDTLLEVVKLRKVKSEGNSDKHRLAGQG